MRRIVTFPCSAETLVGTIDDAAGKTGLLIVSGGNEVRMGAHRGMAMLAARVADTLGAPVFRYDRRGIGDSTGENRGFDESAADIAAAAAAFRAQAPGMRRILAFGNCDAATALALFHAPAGVDALLLSNPWTIENEDHDTMPPAAAIRARYAERLRDPSEWLRLLRGGVNLAKVARGLTKALRPAPAEAMGLAGRLGAALGQTAVPVTVLLARRDNTAVAFREAWGTPAYAAARAMAKVEELDSSSHSFAGGADAGWLFDRIADALAR